MRLWSLHPKYLDSKGLVALWRESLLAQNVLRGKTKGYRHHPQLVRFNSTATPVSALATYLLEIHREASLREYSFNFDKIDKGRITTKIKISDGQLNYEKEHLIKKLWSRDRKRYFSLKNQIDIESHPIFETVVGGLAEWEIVS